jgi:hypothetical protein
LFPLFDERLDGLKELGRWESLEQDTVDARRLGSLLLADAADKTQTTRS